jgi:hypothetical protein
VISSLDPLDRKNDGLVVAVRRPQSRSSTSVSFGVGMTFGRTSYASVTTSRSGSTRSTRSNRSSYARARTRVSASSTRYSARPSRSR